MKIKFLSILSLVLSLFYYLPWIGETSHWKLGPYVIACLWFLFAWAIMLFYFYHSYKKRKLNLVESSLFRNSGIAILVSYLIFLTGAVNGFVVTV